MAVFATDRATADAARLQRVDRSRLRRTAPATLGALCDLVCPPMPSGIFRVDDDALLVASGQHEASPTATGPLGHNSADLGVRRFLQPVEIWNARSREALLRVGPQFALSDLRKEDLDNLKLARLVRDALAAATLPILFVMFVALALRAWVLHFPVDWQGYVPKAILISTSAGVGRSAHPCPEDRRRRSHCRWHRRRRERLLDRDRRSVFRPAEPWPAA